MKTGVVGNTLFLYPEEGEIVGITKDRPGLWVTIPGGMSTVRALAEAIRSAQATIDGVVPEKCDRIVISDGNSA